MARPSLRHLQERGTHGQFFGVVHVVVGAVIRRVRLKRADVQHERAVAVAVDEVRRLASEEGRHLVLCGHPRTLHWREHHRAVFPAQFRLESAVDQVLMVVAHLGAVLALRVLGTMSVLSAYPLVETVLSNDVVPEVPLAEPAGVVVLRGHLSDALPVRRERHLVDGRPGEVRIESGDDRSPRGSAYRLSDVGSLEDEAAVCQRVQARHIDPVVAVAAQGVVPLLVAENEHYVRTVRHVGSPPLSLMCIRKRRIPAL